VDRKIIDTKHAIERYVQRYSGSFDKQRVNKVIEDAMKKIITTYNDEATTYGIYSLSTGICAIIDWRKDNQNRYDSKNHAVVVTLPPVKKDVKDFLTGKDDVRIIVESALLETVPKSVFKESLTSEYIEMYEIEGLQTFFEKGIMFDSGIAFCIEVE